jgi:hypothetical protein
VRDTNGEGLRIGECEHAEPIQKPATGRRHGLMGCERCHDFSCVLVEDRANGFTKVTGIHCLNCSTTVPVRRGVVMWRPPFFYRLGWHLSRLIAGGAL